MRRKLHLAGRAPDAGFSLVELLVSMIIFSVLIALTTGLYIAITYQARDAMARVDSVDQARLGLSQIDRQVRSGNLINDPKDESLAVSGVEPNYSLRIFTQEGGAPMCVQWRVIDSAGDGFADLEFRTWDPDYPVVVDVTEWTRVASNVVAPDTAVIDEADPITWPPFMRDSALVVDPDAENAAQNVRITLRMKDPGAREDSKPISVSSVVTGRNTVFGYSQSNCSNVPAP